MSKWLLLIQQFSIPVLFVVAGIGLGLYFDRRVLKRLSVFAEKTAWKGDDLIIDNVKGISFIWFALGGCYLASVFLTFQGVVVIHRALYAVFLLSITLLVSRLAVSFLQLYSSREGTSPMLTTLFETITKILVLSIGILITLESLNIPIAPILATLGVGSLSLGLALKEPLANLISGINIITSKKIRPQDYIKLKTGEEGYVVDVELKYTVIREITGNLLVIPNAQLIASSFRNYALPENKMLIPVKVGISYDSDLEKVETVTLQVARETLAEVLGGDAEYEPFMRYERFDYFSIEFTVYLQIQEFYDHLIITHEFIKRLYKRYQSENIEIPFPIKNAYIANEKLTQTFDDNSSNQ
ncbi:small-conductance mechanosensitive channel [Xenococcus sp. PCC 7305]|uniref:mechanosensitive ion channel family protein n=1 Tax=Xenococcus sp. PCC 7305 TaxID=102125 RepID=UPI0002ABB82F|nr:mechanosensitive ion channel domain-containing protein [Xenococcus sp. PCC 7305]ELS01559.1 small-conductance mechanosensitive channel [Xenococcus sp. PCC 7305]